jgi:hypothetical protein
LVLLPDSARLVENDDSFRPGGAACLIKTDFDQAGSLRLTEFPDPSGMGILLPAGGSPLDKPRRTSRWRHPPSEPDRIGNNLLRYLNPSMTLQ